MTNLKIIYIVKVFPKILLQMYLPWVLITSVRRWLFSYLWWWRCLCIVDGKRRSTYHYGWALLGTLCFSMMESIENTVSCADLLWGAYRWADRSDGAWSQGHIHSIADLTPVVAKCWLIHCEDNIYTVKAIFTRVMDLIAVAGISRENCCPSDTSLTDILSPVPGHNITIPCTVTLKGDADPQRVAVQFSWWLSQVLISTRAAYNNNWLSK